MLIRERLENEQFSNSEKVIIQYILDQKFKIKDMTTKDIASATYTSPSTLVRIAHKMNYKGWNELKEAYLKEEEYLSTHFSEIDANIPFTRDDSIMMIASKIATLKQEAIADTLSLVTHDDLQKAVQIIRNSNNIYLFGVSNNGLITQEFEHNMSRIKKKVMICNLQGELVYKAASIEKGDCAIIVSYSGETPIFYNVIKVLKQNNIPLIAITSIGDNTVANAADVALRVCTREKLYSKIATYTIDISIEYILDLLYSCIFALDYNKNINFKITEGRLIERGRFSTIDIIKEEEK